MRGVHIDEPWNGNVYVLQRRKTASMSHANEHVMSEEFAVAE